MSNAGHWWEKRSQVMNGLSEEGLDAFRELASRTFQELVDMWRESDRGMSEKQMNALTDKQCRAQHRILQSASETAIRILKDDLVSGRGALGKVESGYHFRVDEKEIGELIMQYGGNFIRHLWEKRKPAKKYKNCWLDVIEFLLDTQCVVYHGIKEIA